MLEHELKAYRKALFMATHAETIDDLSLAIEAAQAVVASAVLRQNALSSPQANNEQEQEES